MQEADAATLAVHAGHAHYDAGDEEAARAEYREALRLGVVDAHEVAVMYGNLGRLAGVRNPADALKHCDEAIRIHHATDSLTSAKATLTLEFSARLRP